MRERVAPSPRALGGPLKGHLREFWRWRLGDYRILARLEDDELLVLVVRVGNRNKIYDKP
ncbi:type II toxin-antitoxin system RelE/ParE family toxin [Desulfocurvibacter africanus]|uniref:type II toxin-antitoxin system RelE family toxin n=1 Tax=Desulfocurvibacter africanus TaxID=873 RepID=UPI0030840715